MAKHRTRTALRPTLISLAVASCFSASTALANPTGANVVRGTAAIHQTGNLLQITNSPNAIINWQSFSIGANEITRFLQQSPSSAVLNRVTTQNPSQILGTLQSKLLDGVTTGGRVFLINPNGILFGAGAQIDVGGLVASTLRMSDDDFLAGRMRFGDGLGKNVVNDGSIATGAGGSVYLIGSGVTNNGIIRSPQGEVVLAAGNSVELVSPGTPNLRVEIAASDHEARNLGQIISDAGRIGIYAGLINNSGSIRADSAVSEGGRILLKASKSVTLEDSSVVSAQGQGGGEIKVLAGESVRVAGRLDASAPNGGNGGFIETSADAVYVAPGVVVTAAAQNGTAGTWLIDPTNFTISPGTGTQIASGIGAVTLSALLEAGTNVEIATVSADPVTGFEPGGITVASGAPVSWTSNNSLTLVAHSNVVLNDTISTTGTGSINLYAGWNGDSAGLPSNGGTPFVQCCGQIGINQALSAPNGEVKLVAGSSISQTLSGVITADRLMAKAPSVSLFEDFGGARNMVNTLAGEATNGSFLFSNGKDLTIDTVAGVSGVSATSNNGSASVQIVVTGGNLTVNKNVSAIAGASVEGPGSASVFLATRSSGSITVQNGAVISAVGADGGEFGGSGGHASVELNTAAGSGGSITVAGGSRLEAFGGNASAGSGSGSGGGSGGGASVTLISDQSITVDNATVRAVAGRGVGISGSGGQADISLFANTSGPLVVNQSTLAAVAGSGSSAGGGFAGINLSSASGITISSSPISATGGSDGLVVISSGTGISQTGTGGISARALYADGGIGDVALDANNMVDVVSGAAASLFRFQNGKSLEIGQVSIFTGGINVTGNCCSPNAIDVNVTNGDLTVTSPVTVSGSISSGAITLSAAGNLVVQNAAIGADGAEGAAISLMAGSSVVLDGGTVTAAAGSFGNNGSGASITLNGGAISIINAAQVSAVGGSGGSGGNGGNAMVSLNGGTVSVQGATVQAFGGGGAVNGGQASIGVNASQINLNSATIVAGGCSDCFTPEVGGMATIALNAGDINLTSSTVSATGGFGSLVGGGASITLTATGGISVSGSVAALGGDGGFSGGAGAGGNASLSLNAGGSITVNGSIGALGGFGSSGNGGSAAVVLTGNGISVNNGLVIAQGGSGDVNGGAGSVTLNGGAGGILAQNTALLCETGCLVQGELIDVKAVAISRVGGSGVAAVGGSGGSTGGAATVVLNTSGAISVLGTFVEAAGGSASTGMGGNAQATLTSGGDITLASNVIANGGLGTTNGTGRIDLIFLNSSSNYVVNGQVGLIFDELTLSGFMVDNLPAILNVNLFVTQGAPTFTDTLIATMNQQADVLADQLKAGDTPGDTEDKDKKKLPFCSS